MAGLAGILLYTPTILSFGPRGLRILLVILAPVLLFATADIPGLWDLRTPIILVASLLAWVPFMVELGGRVPTRLWTLPIVLAVAVIAVSGPWALSIQISDIAPRAQVLVIGAIALLVHTVARDVR